MKAIKITQDLIDKNKHLYKENDLDTFRLYDILPNKFYGVEKVDGGYMNRTDLHEQDGFLEYVKPEYDNTTHKLGDFIKDANTYTREVIAMTQEEIEAQAEALNA